MDQSASLPVFLNTATELVERLGRDRSQTGMSLAREARLLVETFQAWELSPPEPHERANAVKALLDLQRRSMDYLSRGPGLR